MLEDNSEHEITINRVRVQEVHVPMTQQRMEQVLETMPSVEELFAEGDTQEVKQYLNSLNLPDHSKADVNQQQDYVTKQELIKKILGEAKDAAQQAAFRYMAEHPVAEGLGFKFTGRVYAERYKRVNLTQAFIHMLDCLLDRRAGLTTQKAVLDSVKQSTGIHELNANIWTMPLRKFMKAQLSERLKNHGVHVSLAGCQTMSDIRKTIDTYFYKKEAIHKLKLEIAITPNEVIVNGISYSIINVTSGPYACRKIRLMVNDKRTWLNVAELKAFFGLAL